MLKLSINGNTWDTSYKLAPAWHIKNSNRIIATRNRIIHSYDSISVEIIWAIVKRELPKLKEEVATLLKTLG